MTINCVEQPETAAHLYETVKRFNVYNSVCSDLLNVFLFSLSLYVCAFVLIQRCC